MTDPTPEPPRVESLAQVAARVEAAFIDPGKRAKLEAAMKRIGRDMVREAYFGPTAVRAKLAYHASHDGPFEDCQHPICAMSRG